MPATITVKSLVTNLQNYENSENFNELLFTANHLLVRDPNNAEYLLYKLKALEGLGKVTSDLKLLHHYVNMRSTDVTGYLLLYKAYVERNSFADALISLVFALSIEPNDEDCLRFLANLLADIDPKYTKIKLNILTTSRIGHLTCEIEPWVRNRQHNEDDDCLYLFISNGQPSANESLFMLLKNCANVIESPAWYAFYISRPLLLTNVFFEPLPYDINSSLRGESAIDINAQGIQRLINIYKASPAFLKIPSDDIETGWQLLAKYHLTKTDKIVCFHLRDSHYLGRNLPSVDWSYHDYRDAKIATYKASIQYLIEQGYKVVRIGDGSNQSLDVQSKSYVDLCLNRDPDYGDFLEMLLVSVCDFFIATTSGPLGMAAMFDTPTLAVNAAPFEPPYFRHSRFIPKRLMHNDLAVNFIEVAGGKALSASNNKAILFSLTQQELVEHNYHYVDNSEEDILQAVQEFSKQVKSRILSDVITPLQKQYKIGLPNNFPHKNCDALVCDSFLKQYPELFTPAMKTDVSEAQSNAPLTMQADQWLANNSYTTK